MESGQNTVRQTIEAGSIGHLLLQGTSEIIYNKPLSELTYHEASRVVQESMVVSAEVGRRSIQINADTGMVILDSAFDGQEAVLHYLERRQDMLEHTTWSEGELIINVRKDPTLWERIRHRKGKIVPAYHFTTSHHDH